MSLGFSTEEKKQYEEEGFVVRRAVLGTSDLRAIADACEEIASQLQSLERKPHLEMGSYVFEIAGEKRTVIKWEKGARDTMLGVEPVAHLHPTVEKYALDPRLARPMADALCCDLVDLYTEKLNLKRARDGGPIVLHQDYPYWVGVADDAERIATAVLFLDDANLDNGCLQVAPGSHRGGVQTGKQSEAGFGRNEMDPEQFDRSQLVPLEVPAGSVVFLGSLLVHGSEPNRSDSDSRALLYSYQPAGSRHAREYIRIGGESGIEVGPRDS